MNVGMPGTGIGGMFYLVSALATPLSEAYRRVRGGVTGAGTGGWRPVAGQTALAGAILAGMWATGWLLGRSEERRVGKECRSRGGAERLEKKKAMEAWE